MILDGDNADDCKLFAFIMQSKPDVKVWVQDKTYPPNRWTPRSLGLAILNRGYRYFIGDKPNENTDADKT